MEAAWSRTLRLSRVEDARSPDTIRQTSDLCNLLRDLMLLQNGKLQEDTPAHEVIMSLPRGRPVAEIFSTARTSHQLRWILLVSIDQSNDSINKAQKRHTLPFKATDTKEISFLVPTQMPCSHAERTPSYASYEATKDGTLVQLVSAAQPATTVRRFVQIESWATSAE